MHRLKTRIGYGRFDRAVGDGFVERLDGNGVADAAAKHVVFVQGHKGRTRFLERFGDVKFRDNAILEVALNRLASDFQQLLLFGI